MHDLHESILKLGFLNIKVQMNRPITFLTCDALKKTNKEIGHGDAMCTHSEKTVTIQTVPVCRFCSEEAFGKAMDARACCCCAQPLLVSFPFAPPHYQHNFNAKKLFFYNNNNNFTKTLSITMLIYCECKKFCLIIVKGEKWPPVLKTFSSVS